jgi:hypothetical protein
VSYSNILLLKLSRILFQFSQSEARSASLQEQTMSLDVALRDANQRIQQLESK